MQYIELASRQKIETTNCFHCYKKKPFWIGWTNYEMHKMKRIVLQHIIIIVCMQIGTICRNLKNKNVQDDRFKHRSRMQTRIFP